MQSEILVQGPERYRLRFDATRFESECAKGTKKFSGLATKRLPKLYIVSAEGRLIYVGITTQSLRSRLRMGWTATGVTGYHGYKWRQSLQEAMIDVWAHTGPYNEKKRDYDIEAIESEVVYLIRHQTGQWPQYQNEIHFHQSNASHRSVAKRIVDIYALSDGVA